MKKIFTTSIIILISILAFPLTASAYVEGTFTASNYSFDLSTNTVRFTASNFNPPRPSDIDEINDVAVSSFNNDGQLVLDYYNYVLIPNHPYLEGLTSVFNTEVAYNNFWHADLPTDSSPLYLRIAQGSFGNYRSQPIPANELIVTSSLTPTPTPSMLNTFTASNYSFDPVTHILKFTASNFTPPRTSEIDIINDVAISLFNNSGDLILDYYNTVLNPDSPTFPNLTSVFDTLVTYNDYWHADFPTNSNPVYLRIAHGASGVYRSQPIPANVLISGSTSTPINEPPVLTPIGNKTVGEGQLIQFTISATDPDNNNLTYSATNLPSGASFDPQTATFSWIPSFDQEGNYENIEFTVTDNGNPIELDTELIIITVGNVNRAPVLEQINPQEVLEQTQLNFSVEATDPDGDSITLSADNIPAGASFDPQTGVFLWTPTFSQSGIYVVSFYAVDNGSPVETGTIEVPITVGDDPTPTEQSENLITTVVSYDLPNNVENSYLSNLKKVTIFIDEGKIQPAKNQLTAFIAKVNADYEAGIITQTERNSLINLAQALIADL